MSQTPPHPVRPARPKKPQRSLQQRFVKRRYTFYRTFRKDRTYITFIGACFFMAGIVYQWPAAAMWFGFALAGYSAIANDSIQTVGTFIASNHRRPWWLLWIFIGGVFLATVTYSWFAYTGDVTYGRLSAKGFETAPTTFSFLQVAAPIFLLILTRLRIPVSTTFLILTCFATDPEGITSMLFKSLSGYGVAFVVAILAWGVVARFVTPRFNGEASRIWYPMQWVATGFLWSSWIMQDASNIAVYLPRTLGATEFLVFAGFIFFGLGILFYLRGDRIQRVVTEKTDTTDVRSATIIDFIYAFILFYFKQLNNVPMSTTWVFIGLLAGRELAISLFGQADKRTAFQTFQLMGKDLAYAGIGLLVSIGIALGTNPEVVRQLFAGR